jgi:hypothetical protein
MASALSPSAVTAVALISFPRGRAKGRRRGEMSTRAVSRRRRLED